MKTKITFAVLFGVLTILGAWISGFDFNERGNTALAVYSLTFGFSFIGYAVGSIVNLENEGNK